MAVAAAWRDVSYTRSCDVGLRCNGVADTTYRGKAPLSRCKEFCYREVTCVGFEVSGCANNRDACGGGCWLHQARNLSQHNFSVVTTGITVCNDEDDSRCYRMSGENLSWRKKHYSSVLEVRRHALIGVQSTQEQSKMKSLLRPLHSFQAKIALPYFDSPGALRENKKWMSYLQLLYGPSVFEPGSGSFPIDVSEFDLLYPSLLKKANLLLDESGDRPQYRYARHHCFSALHPAAFLVYHPRKQLGLPSYSNVEVMHMGGIAQRPWEGERGYWMYGMLGSGVYYNLGKTAVFETHAQAVRKFLGKNCGGQCEEFYTKLYHKSGLTYHSLQFTRHCDQHCNQCPYEILDLHAKGIKSCSLNFSVGFGGHHPCVCRPLQFFLHCANFGT